MLPVGPLSRLHRISYNGQTSVEHSAGARLTINNAQDPSLLERRSPPINLLLERRFDEEGLLALAILAFRCNEGLLGRDNGEAVGVHRVGGWANVNVVVKVEGTPPRPDRLDAFRLGLL